MVPKSDSDQGSQLHFEPKRFGFGVTPLLTPKGQLAWFETLKTWVALGTKDGTKGSPWSPWSPWSPNFTAKPSQPADGQGSNAARPVASNSDLESGSAATSTLDDFEAEDIITLSSSQASLLQQQCLNTLQRSPRLVAEAFHMLWMKSPWSVPPSQVRAAVPSKIFDLAGVEQRLGYKFSNPLLAVWAMTHSSYEQVWTLDWSF